MNRQNFRGGEYGYDEEDYQVSYGNDEYDYNPKAEGFTTVLTVIAAVIIGGILLYFAGQATGIFEQIGLPTQEKGSNDAERAVMPEFVGIDVEEVKKALNSAGLGCKTTFIESTQYAKNQVISAALEDGQAVIPNDKILMNTTIVLTVSAGANGISVPPVEGLPEAEGTALLTQEGFKVVKSEEPSAEYAKGMIVSQFPVGNTSAPLGTEITIVISTGSEGVEIPMPSVLGNSKDAAISTLNAAGIKVGKIEESYSSEYPEGQICYQSFEAGTKISAESTVDLKISIGAESVTYNCSLMIQAPADYMGGNAEVILMTADGSKQLWYSQNVTAFPVAINLNDFESPSAYGIVIVSYLKNEEVPVVDADGNPTTQMTPAVAQITQNVQFTKN